MVEDGIIGCGARSGVMRWDESTAPAGTGLPPAPRRWSARILCAVGLCLSTLPVGGCGQPLITFQTETVEAVGKAAEPAEPTSTGSIERRPAVFGNDLGAEDWRRAHAAITVALDPQGNGRPVKWDNPETTFRGAVNPTGLPYVSGDRICRDFLASVITPLRSRFLRGTGCKLSGDEWELRRVRPAKAAG